MEQLSNLELKIIALKEGFKNKIASTVEEYEDRIADLRVEITSLSGVVDNLNEHNRDLETRLQEALSTEDEEDEEDAS